MRCSPLALVGILAGLGCGARTSVLAETTGDAAADSAVHDAAVHDASREACPPGDVVCEGVCVDEQTDVNNCGGCGISCGGGWCSEGRCLVTLAEHQCGAKSLAVDETNLYWLHQCDQSDSDGGGIMKLPLAGGDPVTLAPAAGPMNLAIDATSVYWTTEYDSVVKVPIAGGEPFTLVPEGTGMGYGIAVGGSRVYWSETVQPFALQTVPIGGGMPVAVAPNADAFIAADFTSVYWSVLSGASTADPSSTLMKGSVSGTPSLVLATVDGEAGELTVSGGRLLWNGAAGVQSIPVTGGTVTTFEGGGLYPFTVDATSIYGVHGTNLLRVPLAGGAPTTIFSDAVPKNMIALVAGQTSLYWLIGSVGIDYSEGSIQRLTPK
jgi:hypothetical protein